MMASNDTKLFLMDASSSFNGVIPDAYMERRGLSFGAAEKMKIVKSIRPRISGNTGSTVLVQIGSSPDAFTDPVYGPAMTHTIGTTVSNDCMVAGRYIAVKLSTGTAYQWRLDSYDLVVEEAGDW